MKRTTRWAQIRIVTRFLPSWQPRWRRWIVLGAIIATICSSSAAETPLFRNRAPTRTDPPSVHSSSTSNHSGLNGPVTLPPGSYQPDRVGFRHSSIFRSERPIYDDPIQMPPVRPAFRTGGSSGTAGPISGDFSLTLPALTSGLPFLYQGFAPADADLKTGPLYWKLRALTGAVLMSDNVNLSADEREAGAIAMISLGIGVVAQITEGLQLALAGSLVYFPIEGKGGLSGFGETDLYNLGLSGVPLLRSQVVWDTIIGGWNLVLADNFEAGFGSYSNEFTNDSTLLDGFHLDEESRAGRYVFRPPDDPGTRDSNNRENRSDHSDITVFSNTLSASADRLVVGETRLRVRLFRQDLWYNQGGRGQPSLREGGSLSLASERRDMRFKPYFIYEAVRSDLQDSFDHTVRLGVAGPITDQLFFRADYGHYWSGFGSDGELWTLILSHVAGRSTTHEFIYTRELASFNEEVRTSVGYHISQIFGPKLTGDAFILHSEIEDLRGDNSNRTELRAGVRLTLTAGPRTSIRGSLLYGNGESGVEDIETWTGRLEIGYSLTDTLLARLGYQYQQFDSNIHENSYYENLVFLSLTKYFR